MNHTPEPWWNEGCDLLGDTCTPVATTDVDDHEDANLANADRITACVNALAGRVPGELARVEAAADHLLDCAHIPDDVRFLADSDWCIRISVSDYKKLRATLDAFRGEVQQ